MKNNKFKEIIRFIKFALISASAGIIQFGLFALLNELCHFDYWVSYLISLVASVIWNFTINRKFTFKSANNIKIAMLLVALFYVVFTPCSTLLEHYLTNTANWNEYLVQALIMLSNFILEFLYNRFVVYRNSCDTLKSNKQIDDVE